MALPGDASAGHAAIESVLSQSERDLLVLVADGGVSPEFELSADPRLRLLRGERARTLPELLRLAARESNAPFLLALVSGVSLRPEALSALLEPMLSDPAVEMTTGLLFPVGSCAGQVSRAGWHAQWEKGRALRGFDPTEPGGYLALDFLSSNPRVFRRRAVISNLLEPQLRHPSQLLWRAHALLKAEVVFEPVGLLQEAREPASGYLQRARRLLADRGALKASFGPRRILTEALRQLWLNGVSVRAVARFGGLRRWLLRSGLSRRAYAALVSAFRNWPLPRATPASGAGGRPRIAYYIWQFPVQSQTFVQREVAALRRAGEDVVIFTEAPAEQGFIAELEPWLDYSVVCFGTLSPSASRTLRRRVLRTAPLRYLGVRLFVLGHRLQAIKSRRADRKLFEVALRLAAACEAHGVSHLHSPWADRCAAAAMLASRIVRLDYTVQARAHDMHRQDYRFGLEEKFRNARFIITNTQYNVREIGTLIGDHHRNRVRLIYNGLNLGQFKPPPASARDGRGGPIRFLSVARLIDQKGLSYLLQACRQLLDAGLAIHCEIVGDFEDVFMNCYVELRKLHQSLGLNDSVRFAGPLPLQRVLDCYRDADIFVLPCVIAEDGSRDIIPNSVLEAMAMGLPVVATTVTGLPEMVEDGRTGFLVQPHDAAALASAMRRLADAPRLRSEFGRAGRLKVERQFDSERNVTGYRSAFGSLEAKS